MHRFDLFPRSSHNPVTFQLVYAVRVTEPALDLKWSFF